VSHMILQKNLMCRYQEPSLIKLKAPSWGVGGSNPLVPTKKPLKNQPLKAGFFMPEICLGNNGGKTPDELQLVRPDDRQIRLS